MTRASPSGRAGRASPEPASGLGHSATIPDAAQLLYEAAPDLFHTGVVSNGTEIIRPLDWSELSCQRQQEFEVMADDPDLTDARIDRACLALDAVLDEPIGDWDSHVRKCVVAVAKALSDG